MICDTESKHVLLVDWFGLYPKPNFSELVHVVVDMILNSFQHLSYNMPEDLITNHWNEEELMSYNTTLHQKVVKWLNSEVLLDFDFIHALRSIYPNHSELNKRLLDQVGSMVETCDTYVISELPEHLLSQISLDYLSWNSYDKIDTNGKSILDHMLDYDPDIDVIFVTSSTIFTRINGVITERI